MTHRMEWCAAPNKYRCMRCGRNSNNNKMPGKCRGPRWTVIQFQGKHLENALGEVTHYGKKSGSTWRGVGVVQEVLRLCSVPSGFDTRKHGNMLKIFLKLEKGEVPDGNAKGWKVGEETRRVTRT